MHPNQNRAEGPESPSRFVLTHVVPTCLRAAGKCGINVIDFIRKAGISPLTLVPGHGDLPVMELFRLLNEGTVVGWRSSPGGHIPLLFAKCFQFDYLSDATGYLSSSPNLLEASRLFQWVSPLICPPASLEFHMNHDMVSVVLEMEPGYDDPAINWSAAEAILATWARLSREIAGAGFTPKHVEFRHQAHGARALCDEFFGIPCDFGSHRNAITLPRACIEQPLTCSLPVLHEFSKHRLLKQLKPKEVCKPNLQRHNAVLESVLEEVPIHGRQLFEYLLVKPERLTLTADQIAQELDIPLRTLQRRLAESGTSFSSVQSKVRLFIAKEKLFDPATSIEDIAWLLGFPDKRTFSVFFKRLTDMTPREWRSKSTGTGN